MAKTFIFRWNARNQKYYARARTTDRVSTTLFHDRLTYGDDDSQPYIISTNQKANEDMEEKKKSLSWATTQIIPLPLPLFQIVNKRS